MFDAEEVAICYIFSAILLSAKIAVYAIIPLVEISGDRHRSRETMNTGKKRLDATIRNDSKSSNLISLALCENHMEIAVGQLVFHVFELFDNEKVGKWEFSDDEHEHHELIYTISGEGTYETDLGRVDVKAGDFWFVPRLTRHGGWSRSHEKPWHTLVIQLDFSLTKAPESYCDDLSVLPSIAPFYNYFILDAESKLACPPQFIPHMEMISERLASEFDALSPDYELIVQSSLIDLLVVVCRAAKENGTPILTPEQAGRTKKLLRLESARQFIRDNFNRDMRIEEIAEHACLSTFHFVRVFKEAFGITPKRYQLQLRLREAKRLLLTTDMGVSEIAYFLGYSSPEYFSRTFSSKVGVPPGAFAEKKQDGSI
jgi:AraC-like DNA-binding protein/mannose-6-phosphate isomerase-like protein (cupin superfamily)